MTELVALGVQAPQINTVGNFLGSRQAAQESVSTQINQQGARMQQEAAALEQIATMGLGVMGGKLDGQVDPEAFNDMLGMLGSNPLAAKLKANPELLPVITRGSMSVLQHVQDAEKFDLAKQQFQLELDKYNNPPAPTPTDDQREYNMAVEQGYEGTFMDYRKAMQAPGTTVNVGPNGESYGNPGDGLVWKRDAAGKVVLDERGAPIAIPYQGGKVYREQETADTKADLKADREDMKANVVIQDIDRALKMIEKDPFWTTGPASQATGWLGGSPAADVAALIDTPLSNAGFAELQAMRDASPTGGALGSVTGREMDLLQAAVGSLKQSQSAPQLQDNLKRVKNIYLDIIHGEGNGPPREKLTFEGGGDGDLSGMSDDELLQELNK